MWLADEGLALAAASAKAGTTAMMAGSTIEPPRDMDVGDSRLSKGMRPGRNLNSILLWDLGFVICDFL
jgi:hypothetical protein